MDREDITEGLTVRLCGPPDHPLHGAAGTVIRVLGPDDLWYNFPATMLGDPFSWTAGQVLVSLDTRPQDPLGHPWAPVVSVRPCDVEDPSRPAVPLARSLMRELLAEAAAARRILTETGLRALLDDAGFEVDRSVLHGWLLEDQQPVVRRP
jgi:hypothetical protein